MGGWIAGISVFCFAASYFVSLALEASRMWFRSGVRGAVMVGFAAAGVFAHVLFLGYRAYEATVHQPNPVLPLSSTFDWFLIAALLLALLHIHLTLFHSKTAVGLFLLPLVLGLIGAAELWANDEPFTRQVAGKVWLAAHLGFWLVGSVAVLVGFMSGLMYLVQWRRLKSKRLPSRGLQLPSLEWLERTGGWSLTWAGLTLGLGFASALVLNLINHRNPNEVVPWTDPVILASAALTVWVSAAAIFNWVYKPAQHGHKVAYLTVATGVLLLMQLAVSLLVDTQHGASRDDRGSVEATSAASPSQHT